MQSPPLKTRRGYLALVCISVLISIIALVVDRQAILEWLAQQQSDAVDYTKAHLSRAIAIAFVVYVVVTASGFPGSTALSIVSATILPYWASVITVSFASTLGATCAMLMSRYLFRDMVKSWFGNKYDTFEAAWERDGIWYLYSMRMAPYVPFFSINLLMGLTKIKIKDYWVASQVGMLPGTLVNLYLGSKLPPLSELLETGIPALFDAALIISFTLLALVPIIIRFLIKRRISNIDSAK
ncbi:MAG: TVP38/TMEM64 family protein [Planctomycetaceae bacterium]|nr:TVP38/TMEM64 family protein [Planctomycetaceae bacterium]